MRIAMLCSFLPSDTKGGAGYQAHHLANQLVARGHRVTLFSQSPRPDDATYAHVCNRVPARFRSWRTSWSMRSIDWSQFDVVHAHGDDWCLWNRAVPPHVRTMHGSCVSEAWHVPGLKSKMRMLWLAGLETLSCVVADRVVGVSINTTRSYPWIRNVIPNGVDLSVFKPGVKESGPTILFVGTYENRKRGRLLMDVFARQVRPAVPEAKLWMVCSDAQPAQGVDVLGTLSTNELADCYRRAWVFCLPSSYEGFGVPYIEAMASGTAVVATNNVGANEVLQGGTYGRIVEPGNLGQALVTLLRDAPARAAMAEAGVVRARAFSWDVVIAGYETLYNKVIDRGAQLSPISQQKP